MAGESLVYSNARVKAMENSLLSHEKITRMTYAADIDEAVKILYESSYAGGMMLDNPYMYETLLKIEDSKVTAFMREAMPKKSGLECFLVRNDYHNVKALLKAKILKEDAEYMLLPKGLIDIEQLRDAIEEDNYFAMPKSMAKAMTTIIDGGQDEISPRNIDTVLDSAMYSDIIERLSGIKVKSVVAYWQANIDLSNISTLIRLRNIIGGAKLLKESLIQGGTVSIDSILKLADAPIDTLSDRLKFTNYGNIITAGVAEYKRNRSLVIYEREWDNYLLNLFKGERHDIFSVAPIAGYYIAKRIEQKVIRLILVCLKNKVDISNIKSRLRELYA